MRALGALLLALAACGEQKSGLEKYSEPESKPTAATADGSDTAPAKADAPDKAPEAATPTPTGSAHPVGLKLADGLTWRITTVGTLKLPAIPKPMAFAREQQIRFSSCDASGSCSATHEFRHFEAEPPLGGSLEGDEAKVAGLKRQWRVGPRGSVDGPFEVTGPQGLRDGPDGQALAEMDPLLCIHLPADPVAVGTTWEHRCTVRLGAATLERNVKWVLDAVSEDPATGGKRASLSYAGTAKTTATEDGVKRRGQVNGKLFLFLDAGAPHTMQETIQVGFGDQGLQRVTRLRHQFARIEGEGPAEKRLRSDGEPFPEVPPLNAPRPPSGDTPPAGVAPDATKAPAPD